MAFVHWGCAVVIWNWRSSYVVSPMVGPRDWSPKMRRALEDLRAKEALVPKHMFLTKEAAQAAPPFLRDAIEDGTAFVVKVWDTHEIIYVCQDGLLLMSGYMWLVFDGYWGTVEQGLTEVKGI